MIELGKSLAEKTRKPRQKPKISLNPDRPEPHDAPPEYGVAQAVLVAVSHTLAAAPRGGNRCPRLLDSSPLPNFVFSDHPYLTGSASLLSIFAGPAQSIRPSPVQPRLPDSVQTTDPFSHATDSARNARPSSPNSPLRPSSPADSVQPLPLRGPTVFRGLALLCGPAPAPGPARPRSRLAPRGPVLCTVQTASGPVQSP
ncbi:hypothetical protein CRG98_029441 [Punica granatum]|uniref:Uncharacterized protein n=1 Tax=Punica granatum TaxID=22663 RepID=A0A2I0J1J9_PUNGR|nr:hypothetical protein CRG98_029441 [Punica granatum]